MEEFPGSIEARMKLKSEMERVTDPALGPEKGVPVAKGQWARPQSLGIHKSMTKEMNIESKIFLKGSREERVDHD